MSPRKLRFTPPILYVMLTLAEGRAHGYAILEEVKRRSDGEAALGPSSLYYTLGRLAEDGLIEETDAPEMSDDPHAEQRRYFAITDAGRARLRSELDVLSSIVRQGSALGLGGNG